MTGDLCCLLSSELSLHGAVLTSAAPPGTLGEAWASLLSTLLLVVCVLLGLGLWALRRAWKRRAWLPASGVDPTRPAERWRGESRGWGGR